MKTMISSLLVVSLALPVAARADHRDDDERQEAYAHARVIRVEPIYKYIDVEEPEEHCVNEEVRRYRERRGGDVAGATILGGVVGGLIGNQMGRGRGRVASTIAGGMIGAAIGNHAARGHGDREDVRTIRRCEMVSRTHTEQHIDGYWVDYEYRGEIFHTRLSYRPENTIRVRVTVDPVAP